MTKWTENIVTLRKSTRLAVHRGLIFLEYHSHRPHMPAKRNRTPSTKKVPTAPKNTRKY